MKHARALLAAALFSLAALAGTTVELAAEASQPAATDMVSATVYAEGSWLLTSGFNMSYTVNFERATLDFDSARGESALQLSEEGQTTRAVKAEGVDGYVEELRYLVNCIRTGQKPSVVTAQDGMSAVEICEAEERSVHTGAPVAL